MTPRARRRKNARKHLGEALTILSCAESDLLAAGEHELARRVGVSVQVLSCARGALVADEERGS